VLDLDGYLARIGLSGTPTIAEVHRAHVASIPFENLDPQRGVPVSLAPGEIERKLVAERRGGYCFEQNLLLKSALEALGAEVETLLGRVRVGAPPGSVRPRSHLVLRVHSGGETWHADVGFGRGTLLEPVPFGPQGEFDQSGWKFRVIEQPPELVLQAFEDGSWLDLYGFVPEPAPMVDLETSNWYTCTHPRSPFVTGLIVSIQARDGARTTLSSWEGLALTEQSPVATKLTPLSGREVPRLLADRFGLPGFELGPDDRIVSTAADR
jgi:N-hydroxyarylamine O-acetyltransferase